MNYQKLSRIHRSSQEFTKIHSPRIPQLITTSLKAMIYRFIGEVAERHAYEPDGQGFKNRYGRFS